MRSMIVLTQWRSRSIGTRLNRLHARLARLAGVVLFMVASGSVLRATEPPASGPERILASQSHLAAALIGKLDEQHPSPSVVVSPASAAGMLTALVLGADQPAVAAMAKTLQVEPGPMASGDMDLLRDATARGSGGDALTSATRLIFSPSAPPTGEALRRLSGAGIGATVADLTKTAAIGEINAWVSQVTHGKINKVLDAPSPGLRFVALNALYFKADWVTPFEEGGTSLGEFHLVGGDKIRADFLRGVWGVFAYRDDGRFVAVDMPFKGGRYSLAVLTTKDEPADFGQFGAHWEWLTGRDFGRQRRVTVDMPRLKIAATAGLMPALQNLGLDRHQRFPNLTSTPVALSAVEQSVNMELNERGAEVAAVTGGFSVKSRLQQDGVSRIVIDKPFAFALRDTRTGLIIVAGFVSAIDGQPVTANTSPGAQPHAGVTEDEIAQAQLRARLEKMRAKTAPLTIPASGHGLRIDRDF